VAAARHPKGAFPEVAADLIERGEELPKSLQIAPCRSSMIGHYHCEVVHEAMTDEKDIFDDLEGMIVEEARAKYSPTVIDHFLNPRNLGILETPDAFNAMSGMCGDTIGIYVNVEKNRVTRITFVTNGCGPTVACSSAITCMAMGRTVQDAMKIAGKDLINYLGGLPVENTHCADLAANTLRSALAKLE